MSPLDVGPDATSEASGRSDGEVKALEARLVRLWREVLELQEIGTEKSFQELGGDSLALVELGSRLREEFGAVPALEELASELTVEGLARWLAEHGRTSDAEPQGSDRIPCLRRESDRSGISGEPLVLVHPSGGSVLCYLGLVERLAPGRAVFGVQGPSLHSVRPFPGSMEEMAREYLAAWTSMQLETPPVLAGYSFGGVVAYEMARQLEARERRPRLVILLDSKAPTGSEAGFGPGLMGELGRVLDGHEIEDEVEDLEREKALWDDLADLAERHLGDDLEPPRSGRRRRRMGAIQSFFFSHGLFPAGEEFDYRRVRRFLRGLQANLRCARDYPGGEYGGDVVLLQAARLQGADELPTHQHRNRWARSIRGDLRVLELPTRHLELLSPPAVDWVASALDGVLAAEPSRKI